jgi:hypothetical protein
LIPSPLSPTLSPVPGEREPEPEKDHKDFKDTKDVFVLEVLGVLEVLFF